MCDTSDIVDSVKYIGEIFRTGDPFSTVFLYAKFLSAGHHQTANVFSYLCSVMGNVFVLVLVVKVLVLVLVLGTSVLETYLERIMEKVQEDTSIRPNLTSLTPLFKFSDVPTRVGLLLAQWKYFWPDALPAATNDSCG